MVEKLTAAINRPVLAVIDLPQAGKDWVATLVTMLLSVGVLDRQLSMGLGVAAGVVLLLLIHEMGHLVYARLARVPVRSPVFIPGVGAFVRLVRLPENAQIEAGLALAGPAVGGGAAVLACGAGIAVQSPPVIEIGVLSLTFNLLNLVPMSPLDGGRVLEAISPWPNLFGLVSFAVVAIMLRDWLLLPFAVLGFTSLRDRFRYRRADYYKLPQQGKTRVVFWWFTVSSALSLVWLLTFQHV